eukprot:TRINITY_DN4011_c0_g1_i2.p2 TRINITY_DN4011_c0_g1~~TRINITY_DN4011_c0_g1_i2.p2  ORF type:complete len:107 (+),score=9.27 TRINITY_DN4011_c0_g1_i2:211-531(+)
MMGLKTSRMRLNKAGSFHVDRPKKVIDLPRAATRRRPRKSETLMNLVANFAQIRGHGVVVDGQAMAAAARNRSYVASQTQKAQGATWQHSRKHGQRGLTPPCLRPR